MSWTDAARLFNITLAIIALVWLLADTIKRAPYLSQRRLSLSLALAALLVVVIEGSIEQILANATAGFRTALTTSACLWTLFGLYATNNDDERRG